MIRLIVALSLAAALAVLLAQGIAFFDELPDSGGIGPSTEIVIGQ